MQRPIALIPAPQRLTAREGSLRFPGGVAIAACDAARVAASHLASLLGRAGVASRVDSSGRTPIRLREAPSAPGREEGYRLEISPRGMIVEAATPAGFFWAVQTVRQLLPPGCEEGAAAGRGLELALPCLEIVDYPRFPWRGLHLDVSRHFFPVSFIKKLLDLLALHKLNRFHFHLTDDQGWRLAIERYPRLTEVGAWREGSGGRYGGFYSRDEVREIVSYAAERSIVVVPEIEMPGHARAAIAAYPELSCRKERLSVWTEWGICPDVFCPGSEETFRFIENVLGEVAGLFPSEFLHIGGDECPKERWKSCPACQARIRSEGLAGEQELQSYFVRRVEDIVRALGRRLIGWDEILEGGLAPNAAVMSWRGVEGGIEAARAHHPAVMTPIAHCYLDYRQSPDRSEAGRATREVPAITLETVYSYEPVPAALSAQEARWIMGSQANLWTEYVETSERAEYLIFPRLCALSEVVWSPPERSWKSFEERLPSHLERLERLGVS